jgi:hypothetical protein
MKLPRFIPLYLLGRSEFIVLSKDPSLCKFRVASAFCRNEGWLTRLFRSFSSRSSIRSDSASTTGSEQQDSRSRQSDGEDLLVRDFRRRTEEPPCSSRYYRRNTEANDRMRLFHPRLYSTRLWRYVVRSLMHSPF